ncbi:cytochrome o ubiquinol oxidase subunit IV [Sagittula stellata]|uniref:Cytochrome bo(3) ubiquinol oxidase subunit 4 n=1 Tax=Sagittula stellata (strain ATCC 700073 / DSM 11524 / E-37) TaxID=388399 RepID=A3K370_SAGS3|nr:cytochrome o ubiquinol oxidase subunit IV [Sagittula stellata]EBA08629.1 cytochrome O ubiquinol oxidase subunit IV [Sagittula stellata E-37]
MNDRDERAQDLRMYFTGFAAAIVLTALSFATAILQPFGPMGIFASLAVLAAVQVVVHFRFFLHIDFSRQKREDLQLILFTGLIIAIMVAGTVWVLGNLMARMM